MISEFKIPTILGLMLLITGLITGTFLVTRTQIFKSQAADQSNIPKNITITNVSDTSASIYWQTDKPLSGFVQAGSSTALGTTFLDDRDLQKQGTYQLHFITLTNLTPNTTYYFKIGSGPINYPPGNSFLSFKTTTATVPADHQPLTGTILNSQMQPITEAIINLEIPGAQILSTITRSEGNFLLPLTVIHNQQLSQTFNLNSSNKATLTVFDPQANSRVTFTLSDNNTIIPPIILGKNIDLTAPTASPSPTTVTINYDVNGDGVINSLDLSMIVKNRGKNSKNKNADLNHDGLVDQKDVDLFNQYFLHLPTKS